MISPQTAEQPEFHALTQFKTCDMDETERHQRQQQQERHRAEVHRSELNGGLKEVESTQPPATADADASPRSLISQTSQESHAEKGKPPPPPPRRTPPKDDLSALVDECNQLANKFKEELGTIDDNLKDLNQDPSVPQELQGVPQTVQGVPQVPDSSIQLHPLRILSEENLTVISSFAGGSTGDLRDGDHEDIDPSKLSFFEVSCKITDWRSMQPKVQKP